MILIGLGANLPSRYGPPRASLERALAALEAAGLRIRRRSRWYESAPVPPSDQPWFVNGVAELATGDPPEAVLARLLAVEATFGRARSTPAAPRVLDLDLLAYHDHLTWGQPQPQGHPDLPHPRLHERAFVLVPLAEIAPDWRHPAFGLGAAELLARLGEDQPVRALP